MPYEDSEIEFEGPMGRERAEMLTHRLLGCYPSPNLHDAEIWIATAIELLAQYPFSASCKVIERLSRTCRFVPSIAEIAQPLHEQVMAEQKEYLDKREREEHAAYKAQLMLEAIVNPPTPEPPKPPRPTLEELHAKYGRTWGIDPYDDGRHYPQFARMTKEQALARLRAEFGDIVDAVPDAPARMQDWRKL